MDTFEAKTRMPIEVIHRESDSLVVYFSSIKAKPEFYGTFKQLNYSTIYVLDNQISWFTQFGNGETFFDVTNKLASLISKINPIRIMFSGTSMGGFGAIRYAHALTPDKVVVFSPQVDLTFGHARKHLNKTILIDQPNLYETIKNSYNIPTDLHVGIAENGKNYWGDTHHAALMERLPSVRIFRYPDLYEHNSANYLKTNNKLLDVFQFD